MNYKYFTIILLTILSIASCTEIVNDPVIQIGDAPKFITPSAGSTFILKEDQAKSELATFIWSEANYGYSAAVSYRLEMDQVGANFANKVTLGISNHNLLSVTQEKVNNILLASGIEQAVPVNIEVRVVASISDDVPSLVSAPVRLTVTPFIVEVIYPQLQVPGAHQGWDPSNNSTVIYSIKSDGNFEGYMYFASANTEFKYTNGPSWDENYGDTGATGKLVRNGDNIKAGAAGTYRLRVNLNTLTHNFGPANWGVIGSATAGGWDSDQDLSYDAAKGILTAKLDLKVGEIKFRANDAWDLNFGDDGANGSLEYNGANIAVASAGNYTIEVNLSKAKYTYKVIKN